MQITKLHEKYLNSTNIIKQQQQQQQKSLNFAVVIYGPKSNFQSDMIEYIGKYIFTYTLFDNMLLTLWGRHKISAILQTASSNHLLL